VNAVTPISAEPGAVNEALQQALDEMDAAAWVNRAGYAGGWLV
jgi:hypothetical protein